jgi:hypothetical protein
MAGDRGVTAPPRRPLVFLHIPKTSGIAVAHALVAAEQPPRVWFDRAFFGGFSDFAGIAPDTRAFIHLSPATIPAGESVIRAHMSLTTLRAACGGARFMTVLREPACRILSHFVFWRGFSAAQMQPWGGWAAVMREAAGPLAAFLASRHAACQIDNVATRLLLWPHPLIPQAGMIDPAHDATLIAEASARLATLDFAAALESPDFAPRLAAFLGAAPALEPHNVSPPLPGPLRTGLEAELTGEARALLAARSRLDLALWHQLVTRDGHDPAALRQDALARGLTRVAALLAP